jgi:hypothetical protein
MHTLGPAVARFLQHRTTGKGQPRFIEKCAGFVGTGDPNQHRRHVGDVSEAFFAFVLSMFRALHAVGNIFDTQKNLLTAIKLSSAKHKNSVADSWEILFDFEVRTIL